MKKNNSLDDSKWRKRKMSISCSEKVIGDFYFLNCLYSFRAENKLKSHGKVYKNKGFCGIKMLWEEDKR